MGNLDFIAASIKIRLSAADLQRNNVVGGKMMMVAET
jgi:hypothetical protein